MNKSGPRTESCGIPCVLVKVFGLTPFMCVCFLLVR